LKIKVLALLIITLNAAGFALNRDDFDRYFVDKTLRLDVVHSGTGSEERFAENGLFEEPVWSGSVHNLLDTLNLGKYLLEVVQLATNRVVYSSGFCSVFGEWQTTGEARNGDWRSFDESLRFPWPKSQVKVTVQSRDKKNVFRPVWTCVVDPSDKNIVRTVFFRDCKVFSILQNGGTHEKIDLLILPDGYSAGEMAAFRKDAKRFADTLLLESPFLERKSDFNILALEAPSQESGISDPLANQFRDNLLSCSFNSLNTDRYALTLDNRTLRKLASRAPYDAIIILLNTAKYGGGGIYNLYMTCTANNPWSGYVLVHEFGHSFGGLGDEYYTSEVSYVDAYPLDTEPWEPNITALLEKASLKWRAGMQPGTPLPTPWDKDVFDQRRNDYQRLRRGPDGAKPSKARIDSLVREQEQWEHDFLRSRGMWGKTGAFEGSGYAAKGMYRPFIDCRMFSRSRTPFDPVCRKAIEKVMDYYTR
jgi:hypothetical protein